MPQLLCLEKMNFKELLLPLELITVSMCENLPIMHLPEWDMFTLLLFSPFSLVKNRMVTIDLPVAHSAELN